MTASRTLLAALVLLGPTLRAHAGKEPSAAAEAKARAETALELASFATACVAAGAKTAALAALEEARGLDAASPAIGPAAAVAEAAPEDPATAAAGETTARRAAGPRIAKAYERLAAVDHEPAVAPRFERYVLAAVRWDPSKARTAKVLRAVEEAAKGSRAEEAGRLLVGVRRADEEGAAAGRYDRLEAELAARDVCLVGSSANELVAWVSLPRDWTKGKRYPVLVGVEGAGSAFLGYARASKGARGSRSVVLVAPCTLSNTNALEPAKYPMYDPAVLSTWDGRRIDFDGPGVEGVLDAVRARFGGEERVFLTGFSGGGNYTYWKLLHDPAHVRGAAPACANFSGLGLDGAPGAGEGGGPVVWLQTGEKDPYREQVAGAPGIEAQTDAVEKALAGLGYAHVTRTMVPGAGHDAFHAKAYELIDRVLGAR